MRTLLLLCWGLVYLPATAQMRVGGPWRVVNRTVRYKTHKYLGGADEWGALLSPATTTADTTTAVRVQRSLHRVSWDVHPDSITLFLDCQNPLTAPSAPRGRLAPVRFEATGATVRLAAKQRLLLLVPSAPVVVLRAYRGQHLLFRHEFTAIPPPLPTVRCYTSECGMGCKPAIYTTYIRTITLRAIPDPDFAAILPDDARYRVARFRTTLLRQGKPVELANGQLATLLLEGPQGDLSNLESSAQLGDQLQTDVLVVQRQNFQGLIAAVPVTRRFTSAGPKCPEQE